MNLPTSSVPATSTTGATATTSTTAANSSSSSLPITQNQFLQMLMTELQNQNPMNPNSSDPMSFVTELAQFTPGRAGDRHGAVDRDDRVRAEHGVGHRAAR